MSLYNEISKIFEENSLKNKNGIAYYIEGIPVEKDERNEYINILVRNKSLFKDIIIDNSEMTLIISELKNMFKIKDMSQEPFIIKKCLEKIIPYDNVEKEFKELVSEYKFYESKTLSFDSLINFCGKLVYTINKNRQDDSSIIYYGDITKGKVYYLRFMNKLGYNIIIINPKENSPKQIIPIIEDYFKPIKFKDKILNFKIPDEEIISTIETNAYKAEQQVNIFYEEDNKIVSDIVNVPIITSYEDLTNLWLTPINERKGYKIQNGTKYLPNFICKINGVESDEDQFRNKLQNLITDETIIFNKIYETDKFYGKDVNNNLNEVNKILKENIKEILNNKLKKFDNNLKKIILSDRLIDIIQKIDKDNYNPKLFIFHNDKVPFNKMTLEVYKFYQSLGFDILMVSPSGYAGIEQLDNCNLYELDKYDSKFKFKKNKSTNIIREFFRRW